MHAIATLTMNPALDVSTTTHHVMPTHKVRCGPPRYDPGGGGINVARVVKLLGGESVAVYPAGGPTGEMLRHGLDVLGVVQKVVPIAGMTRESLTVNEAVSGDQYRFVLPGPTLSEAELQQCLDAVREIGRQASYLVVSGGYPPGASPAKLSAGIVEVAKQIGARLILDTSQAMRHAPGDGIYLMKPSQSELGGMLGRELESISEVIEAAQSIIEARRTEAVVVSLGSEGALLVTDELAEHFETPKVPIRSAVGAGDAMVGAIVLALERGWSLTDAVEYGVAAGAATIMTDGTELCHRDDVERLYKQMSSPASQLPAPEERQQV
jgi:6-phosphofructokinase 2